MHDQAKALRGLMEHRSKAIRDVTGSDRMLRCHRVTITSGKGGVGKSNVALNLAMALAQAEKPVLLLDVNWGVGNVELLCRRNSPWNLSHVLNGTRRLDEILVPGPMGVTIVPGVGSLADYPQDSPDVIAVADLLTMLEEQFPFVIVDLGTGLHRVLRRFISAADRVLVVTTPEPPSIAETYAAIKSLSSADGGEWEVLINQAGSAPAAERIFQRIDQTTRAFLEKDLVWAGWIPQDSHIPAAVAHRNPFLSEHPHSPASEAVRQIAHRLIHPIRPPKRPSPQFPNSSAAADAFPRLALPCV